jgi:hypothetical protein
VDSQQISDRQHSVNRRQLAMPTGLNQWALVSVFLVASLSASANWASFFSSDAFFSSSDFLS